MDGDKLTVSIRDDVYDPRIPPSGRSDGFRWYLSFYCACITESSSTRPTVLLLDNPGLELHADQQREAKKLLENKLPTATQVVYVTHSSAMIDPYDLKQLRKVELLGEEVGTKVSSTLAKAANDLDLLEPVRSAIGASLITTLTHGEFSVLAEGAADKPIIDAALDLFRPKNTEVMVNGSVAESNGFLAKFYHQSGLPYAIYVDSDSGGREIKNRLDAWGIPADRVVELREALELSEGRDYELEDILSNDFYHSAVESAYPDKSVPKPSPNPGSKITKHYEREFKDKHGIGYNKRRVAEAVKTLVEDGNCDESTNVNLKKLSDAFAEKVPSRRRRK